MWMVEEQWDPQRIRSVDAAERDKNNKKNIHCLATQCGQYAVLVPPGNLLEMENLRVYQTLESDFVLTRLTNDW